MNYSFKCRPVQYTIFTSQKLSQGAFNETKVKGLTLQNLICSILMGFLCDPNSPPQTEQDSSNDPFQDRALLK